MLVIVAMGTFLPEPILGMLSLLVLLLAVGYAILLPFDRLLKRRMAAFGEKIEREVLKSADANSLPNRVLLCAFNESMATLYRQ